jgi:hypothetical protein
MSLKVVEGVLICRVLPPKMHGREAVDYFPNSFSTLDFSHSRCVANRLG